MTVTSFASTLGYDVFAVTDKTWTEIDITSATLSLWTTNDLSDNDRAIRVYRLKTAFDES